MDDGFTAQLKPQSTVFANVAITSVNRFLNNRSRSGFFFFCLDRRKTRDDASSRGNWRVFVLFYFYGYIILRRYRTERVVDCAVCSAINVIIWYRIEVTAIVLTPYWGENRTRRPAWYPAKSRDVDPSDRRIENSRRSGNDGVGTFGRGGATSNFVIERIPYENTH